MSNPRAAKSGYVEGMYFDQYRHRETGGLFLVVRDREFREYGTFQVGDVPDGNVSATVLGMATLNGGSEVVHSHPLDWEYVQTFRLPTMEQVQLEQSLRVR